MRGRRLALLAVLTAGVLAVGGTAAIGSLSAGQGRAPTAGFRLAGHVSGLYPGGQKRLPIVVRNRGRRPIRVRSITTRVGDARVGCSGSNLEVTRFHGHLRVRGRRSRRVTVRVSMRVDSPDACQGAVFPLVFRGRATRG